MGDSDETRLEQEDKWKDAGWVWAHGSNEDLKKHSEYKNKTLPEMQKSHSEQIKATGYIQGVCECLSAVSDDKKACKKIMAEMKVTKEMAQKYAKAETFEALEKTVFAPTKQEQKLERQQQRGRGR